MKVTWSVRALTQLGEAHAYIAKDDASTAGRFVGTIKHICTLLSTFPAMGVETDEPQVMVFPLVRYRHLILYTILENEIRILRIRHTSRNHQQT
jgi:plasmid stabilization system protein ParE